MKKSKIVIVIAAIILYAPLAYLMFYSFNSANSMSHFESFTLEHYANLFSGTGLLQIVANSIVVGILSALLAVVFGTLGAIAIYQLKNPKKNYQLKQLNNIMILAPDVVIGVAFLSLFTMFGIKLGLVSVVLTHAVFCTPIVVITLLPRLEQIEVSQIKAALDLGAKAKDIIKIILLPNIEDAIILSFFTSIFYSFDDFGVTFFVTGNGFVTLPIEIYSQARRGINLELNALSTIMIIIIFMAVIGYQLYLKRGGRNA
ncbi:ABC transporter permease [Mollicutes bacterium LVI A0078]|nr:ABC transporter permease [Mollicutes bacterium LVI A0075]WOO90853.1 ABC transporter permease [Mollicutes bacterium LVI A0078]